MVGDEQEDLGRDVHRAVCWRCVKSMDCIVEYRYVRDRKRKHTNGGRRAGYSKDTDARARDRYRYQRIDHAGVVNTFDPLVDAGRGTGQRVSL